MSDDYTVALDAAAENVQKETKGKPPNQWDAEKILETSGAAAATAVCSAYGLAAAAPVCAWLGGKVGAFIADIGDRIGSFFKGVFGKKPPKPSLIKVKDVEPLIRDMNATADMWLRGYASELVNVYWQDLDLGKPGEYGERGALEDMRRIGGLSLLPRDVTRPDQWTKTEADPEGVRFPMPAGPDFEREFRKYAETLNPSGGGFNALSTKQKVEILGDWQDIHMQRWMRRVQEVTAQVAVALATEAVASQATAAMAEAQNQPEPGESPEMRLKRMFGAGLSDAQWTEVGRCVIEGGPYKDQSASDAAFARCRAKVLGAPGAITALQTIAAMSPQEQAQLKELAALKTLPPEKQAQLRDLAALKELSPEEQESLRQLAELKKLDPTEQVQLKAVASLKKLTPEEQQQIAAMGPEQQAQLRELAKLNGQAQAPPRAPEAAPARGRVTYGPYPQTVTT